MSTSKERAVRIRNLRGELTDIQFQMERCFVRLEWPSTEQINSARELEEVLQKAIANIQELILELERARDLS